MRWKGTLVLIVGMLLAVSAIPATASVWENVAKPGVTVGEPHVGDQLRYELSFLDEPEDVALTVLEMVAVAEGAADAADRFGEARAVETHRVDVAWDGERRLSLRCAALLGGTDVVRRDVLEGELFSLYAGSNRNVLDVVDGGSSTASFVTTAMFSGDCPGRSPLAGEKLREGQVLPLDAVRGLGVGFGGVADASLPAVPSQFHDRPALTFHFPAQDPEAGVEAGLTVTFADGLPAPVNATFVGIGKVRIDLSWADSDEHPVWLELAGFEAGTGERVAHRTGAAMPAVGGTSVVYEPLGFDDAAFGFAYPFAEAFGALASDPTTCFSQFLADHPDAFLARIGYDASERDPLAPDVPTEGGWTLLLRAGDAGCEAFSVRLAPQTAALLPASKVVRNYDANGVPMETAGGSNPDTLPARVTSSAHVATLLQQEGVDPRTVEYVYWNVGVGPDGAPAINYNVGDVPLFGPYESGSFSGTLLAIDPLAGGIERVLHGEGDVRRELSVDPQGADFRFPAYEPGVLSALGGPAAGAGLALTTLAGLALVVTAVKFALVPFYTRLRRAALLENPVRARLYEAVRQDPGIHQAQLVDFAGIGRSATARHLDRLVKFRYLVELRDDGHARYYAAGEVPPDVARRAVALRSETARAVYELYRAQPDLPLREAARRLGMSAPGVHKAKRKLEAQGLLEPRAEVVTVDA